MSSPSSHAAYTFNEDVLVPSKLAADRPIPPGPRRMETAGKSAVGHETAGSEGRTLWVGNLDIAVTKEQLRVIFHAYTVKDIRLVLNDFKGYVIAYAFVDLANTDEAHHAIRTLCGRRKLGRTLWIQIARSPDQNTMPKPCVKRETVMTTPAVINGTPAPTMQEQGDRKGDGAQSAGSGARHVLYIRNLPYEATEPELEEFFSGFSPLWVSIATNRHTGRPKGYGFVHVATEADARRAIRELCGKKVQERHVSVQPANDPISWGSPHGVKVETTISTRERQENTGCKIPEDEKTRSRIALEHVVAVAEGRSMYITYDTHATTEDDIRDLFEEYDVEMIYLAQHTQKGHDIGYGYVDVYTREEACRVLRDRTGKTLNNRCVKIQPASMQRTVIMENSMNTPATHKKGDVSGGVRQGC